MSYVLMKYSLYFMQMYLNPELFEDQNKAYDNIIYAVKSINKRPYFRRL